MTEHYDADAAPWHLRPWIMGSVCAFGGLIFWLLTDHDFAKPLPPVRQSMATFVAVGTLSLVLTIERLRWSWAIGFALLWALITAFVGWSTASYGQGAAVYEWPYFAGLFAVLLAGPLFQTIRDEGTWQFPYPPLYAHVWNDAVIGAASLFFTGLTFLLAWLIAGLFATIGIDALNTLLAKGWFGWTLAGFAFGAAVGILREQDRFVPALQRLAMAVLRVLAPVLAFALAAFLVSIAFTGVQGLWDSWLSATALLLAASAGAVLLVNAVIAESRSERPHNRVLHLSALVLAAVILPLSILAALALGLRIDQYGWTSERIWGSMAVVVAVVYGLGGWWAILAARQDFDEPLRPFQTRFAIGLCAAALLLALPIVDFGAISARSQLARLEQGKISPNQFDWAAMAFDFGPTGRDRLAKIARSGPAAWREPARSALQADERWAVAKADISAREAAELTSRIRVLSGDLELTPEVLRRIAAQQQCLPGSQCALLKLDQSRLLLVSAGDGEANVTSTVVSLNTAADREAERDPAETGIINLETATIELRPIERRQLFVEGRPVGEPLE
jgi:hypothetical protein